jgi:alpha-glucoside transport system substrate-binding protein
MEVDVKKQLIYLVSLFSVAVLLLTACTGGGSATPTPASPGGGLAAPTTSSSGSLPTTMSTEASSGGSPTTMATSASGAATPMATTAAGGTSSTPAGTSAAVPVTGPIDCAGAKQGDTVSLLYQWSGVEEQNILSILKPLVDKCGIVLKPESTRDQALLDTRVKAGTPPDIAFWNVVQLQQYATQLQSVTDLGANASNYPSSWQKLGSVNGKWVGLPVKTDVKTIFWYSPTNFQALGYQVPKTWSDLSALADKMSAAGNVPFATGFESGNATGWTGADFIEDILLVQQGPDFVRGLIDGSKSFNDPGVKQAFETYGKWARDPKYAVGGAQGTLSTNFQNAIFQVYSDPPQAMMDRQSGFAAGLIAAQFKSLKYGTDYDFFQVPDAKAIQTGADWMMAFKSTPAVKAVFTYIGSATGAQAWAAQGFDISPNTAAKGAYKDPALTKKADVLYSATDTVPTIGDTIPGGFGTALWTGIVNYVNGGNLDTILTSLAAAQKQALGK